RQVFHLPLSVPNFDMVQVRTSFHPRPNQSAVHRIRVPLHVDQAARIHLHPLPFGRFHSARRQLPHHGHLFGQPGSPPRIPPCEQLLEQLPVLGQALKLTTPSH